MTSICSSCCWFPRAGSFFWRSAGVTGIWPRRVGISPRTWPCHWCHRPIPPSHRSPRRSPRPSSRLCAMPRHVQALRRNHLHQRLHQWKYNTIRPGSRNADAKNIVWFWDWHWSCKKLATVNIICTSLIFWHPALEDMTLAVLHTEWEQVNLLQEEFQNAAGIFEKLLERFTLVGSDAFFVSMDSVRQFHAGGSSCLAHSTDSTNQDLYQLAETVVEQLAKFLSDLSASDFFSLLSTHHTNEIELLNLYLISDSCRNYIFNYILPVKPWLDRFILAPKLKLFQSILGAGIASSIDSGGEEQRAQQVTGRSLASSFLQEVLRQIREAQETAIPCPARSFGKVFSGCPACGLWLFIYVSAKYKGYYFRYSEPLMPWAVEDIQRQGRPWCPGIPVFGNTGAGKSTLLKLGLESSKRM